MPARAKPTAPCRRWVRLVAPALLVCLYAGLVAAQSGRDPAQEPLDLNTATAGELQKLPGIGPKTAEAIIRFREKSGPFRRLEDLLAIRGITRKKLERLRPLVTVKPVEKPDDKQPKAPGGWACSR